MEIKDLHAKQGNVDLVAEVVDKSQTRTFDKFGKQGKVCNAKIKDGTGTITLSLWNEDADAVNVGDKIKIVNGYVSEWQGELQLSAGKFGKIEVLEKGVAPVQQSATSQDEDESDDEEDEMDDESDMEEEFF